MKHLNTEIEEMGNNNFKILVVDDTEELLMITERILLKAGYDVSTANNGADCLESIKHKLPDIILLDVLLPDANGFDICNQIKSNPETASAFIILMSGIKTRTNDIAEGLEIGSDGYITRPIPERELLARIKAACRTIKAESELRNKNFELEKINAEKDKFFSIIAHDLRNPFTSFLGLTELMLRNLNNFSIQDLKLFTKRLNDNANNLFDLLTNLLEWSKMLKDSSEFEPSHLKLKDIVKANIDLFTETARLKEIEVTMEIEDNVIVYADKFMLDTIIRNLISNSIKFSNKRGKVYVSGKVTDDNVELIVKDNGIGMSRQMIDDLFKINKRTSRKGTNNELSTGLGLILCKEYIEKHDGSILVSSIERLGSEFTVRIPVA